MKNRTLGRCKKLALPIFILAFGCSTYALADISPPGCTNNVFSVDITKNKSVVVPGEQVTYEVYLENEGPTGGCSVNEVTFDFICPAADGTATGTVTNVVTNQSYDFGFPNTLVGTFICTMPQFNFGVTSAQAKVDGTGNLRDSSIADPITISKTLSVQVLSCDVQIDKQISCDGVNWADALNAAGDPQYAPDGANGCTTLNLDQVQVRWYVKNNGTADLSGCTFTESNNAWGGPVGLTSPFDTLAGSENVYVGTNTPTCSAAVVNEPNTATVSCNVCNGVTQPAPITDSDSATLTCLQASLKVDKQVSCGSGYVDTYGLTVDNDLDNGKSAGECFPPDDCQTQGCKAPYGGLILAKYQAANTGTAPLYACTLVDSNNMFGTATPAIPSPWAPGGDPINLTPPNSPECSADFDALEPNTVTLTCCMNNVADLTACPEGRTVQAFDIANVQCIAPDLSVTKTCVLNEQDQDSVTVAVSNTGSVDLANCVATDAFYSPDDTCDLTGLPLSSAPESGTPTGLTLTGSPIASLPIGGSANLTATFTLTENACNTVMVTCDVVGTTTQITRYSKDECPAPPTQGCLTRTPGFWATHPFIIEDMTGSVKNGVDRSLDLLPLSVCGVTLDTTAAVDSLASKPTCKTNGHSTSEALCSVGNDSRCLEGGPQMNQLIRQCTAAKLNVAASRALEGSCQDVMSITETIASCCETADTCTTEGTDIGWCIDALDAFNNWEMDGLNFPWPTGPANPTRCQNAKNNGVVVSP